MFKPNENITRQEMAVLIARALKEDGGKSAKEIMFSDGDKVSSWAKASVQVAVNNEIVSGYSDNTFRPLEDATRAEAIVMLERSLNYNEKTNTSN